jgi:hypothetical protein
MSENKMDWVKEHEAKRQEEQSKDYFNIVEGANKFVLLTHLPPLAQVFDPTTKKYRPAVEGDTNVSIKGVGWVLQDDTIKLAKLPYTVVKAIVALSEDSDWNFKFPFLHPITVTAKNAGSKEVEYTVQPSPKQIEIPEQILEELKKKPTPEEMIEKIKEKVAPKFHGESKNTAPDYPDSELTAEDIPF